MGRFHDLMPAQERILRVLAEKYHADEVTTWLLAAAGGTAEFIACDGRDTPNVENVPAPTTFYAGLESMGYLTLGYATNCPEISIQKPLLDYWAYLSKDRFQRWLEDARYDLLHETTLLAKLLFLLFGFAGGIVVTLFGGILLRVLGWIKIGG